MTRVLLLGASGLFGRGLAQGLAVESGFELILAGRRIKPLEALRAGLIVDRGSQVSTQVLDLDDDTLSKVLQALKPDLLIHCAGPFQGADYRVAEACIGSGVHYVDLADGRAFVAQIATLDERARAANCVVLSGASTVPALSSAVVRRLAQTLGEVRAIDVAIAPGNRTERGLATVAAILSYCGKPIPAWRNGQATTTRGWFELRRADFAKPINRRWQSAVDLPDVALLPREWPELRDLRLSAGLELSVLHLGLWALSCLARFSGLSLARWAPAMKWCSDWLVPFGSDVGGMSVTITGVDTQGHPAHRRFDLIAEHGIGPRVPTLAAVILAKRLRDGSTSASLPMEAGARPCHREIDYAEFESAWQALGMRAQIVE